MQNNYVVLITKHQSLKACQHFLLFLLVIFYRSVKFHRRKILVTCCIRDRHEKNSPTTFCCISICECSGQITGKTRGKTVDHPINRNFLGKRVQVFALQRFIDMSRLFRGICMSTQMPPANKITELLAFNSCCITRKIERRD